MSEYWTTKDKEKILIADLSDEHLEAILNSKHLNNKSDYIVNDLHLEIRIRETIDKRLKQLKVKTNI